MTVARVGSVSTSPSLVSSSPAATTLPQTATKNNLLRLDVLALGGSAPTITTPSGFAPGPTVATVAGGAHIKISTFYKVAAGSDTAPSVAFTAPGLGILWAIREISGLAVAAPLDASGTFTLNEAGGVSGNCNPGTVTTTNANDWIDVAVLGFGDNFADIAFTFGGGAAADTTADTGFDGMRWGFGAAVVASTGAHSPTVAFVDNDGDAVPLVASVALAFKQAPTGPPPFTGWGIPIA